MCVCVCILVHMSTQEECVCAHKYTRGVHEYTWGKCAIGTYSVLLTEYILGQTSNLSVYLENILY